MTVKVLALVGEMDGPALWRVTLPFSELQRQGYPGIDWDMKDNDWLSNIVHQYDAIILPRQHWDPTDNEKADRWFGALHRAGIAVIYEMDDDLVSDDFIRRIMYKNGYSLRLARSRRKWITRAIRACDGVTVSCQRLATMVREITSKPVVVVPNYIDLRWFGKIQGMNRRDPHLTGLTIGWAGGNRPEIDFEIMVQAWGRIARKYPQVTFVIQGHHSKLIYDTLPNDRIAMIDWLPVDGYPAGLLNIDIGCCPLGDTQFNRAKTFIKAMEYAASGAAVVASPTVYNKLIEHGVDGYIAETVDEWEEYLSRLVESEDLRRGMAAVLLAKVHRYHSLEANAWRWVEAWGEIIADYHHRQRLPRILLPEGVIYA